MNVMNYATLPGIWHVGHLQLESVTERGHEDPAYDTKVEDAEGIRDAAGASSKKVV